MDEIGKLIEKCKEAVKKFRECGVTDELCGNRRYAIPKKH